MSGERWIGAEEAQAEIVSRLLSLGLEPASVAPHVQPEGEPRDG